MRQYPLRKPASVLRGVMAVAVIVAVAGGCNGGSRPREAAVLDGVASGAPVVPAFSGQRALELIRQQCAFGPRSPGSAGHGRMLQWLEEQLRPLARRVFVQRFRATTPFGGPYDFANVLGWFGPAEGTPFLLVAHWDTRPVADQDPDPANRKKPVPGANDGGSGVAVLLELARLMHDQPPPVPVVVALVDAEDSGKSDSHMPYMGFCIGSKYLADNWPNDWSRPQQGILVDMVGGDGQRVKRIPVRPAIHGDVAFDLGLEGNSLDANPSLVNLVWSTAEELGHRAFVRRPCGYVTDDHVPLIEAGIKVIDIIEVFPVTWHTVDDTPEHCSADSLRQVGDTLVHVIYSKLQ